MARKKPVLLLVFGIINLAVGGIGLLFSLCCGAFSGLGYVGLRKLYEDAGPQDQKEWDDIWHSFSDNVPGLPPFLVAWFAAWFFLAMIQIISGIGLVRIRSWGRWLCATWGLLQFVVTAAALFYLLAVLAPGLEKSAPDLEKWWQKQEERQRAKGQPVQPRQRIDAMGGTGNPLLDNLPMTLLSLFFLIYGGLAFVIMALPQTGKTIARYHGKDDDILQGSADRLYDDEDERRRRPE
jgi:hypothetical protein